jgi:hypothetical protein
MKIRSKGTSLSMLVATVYTAISQMVSIDKDAMTPEHYESDTLDNAAAGIPYDLTGRTEGGSLKGTFFFDPALSIHKQLLYYLVTPTKNLWQLTFANTAATVWSFGDAGVAVTAPKVALKSGVMADLDIKLDGLPTFPA